MSRTIRRTTRTKRFHSTTRNLQWKYVKPSKANLYCSYFEELTGEKLVAMKAKFYSDNFKPEKAMFRNAENREDRTSGNREVKKFMRNPDHEVIIDKAIRDRTWYYY